MAAQRVLVVLFDGVQSLDVTGPVEVFAGADLARPGSYTIQHRQHRRRPGPHVQRPATVAPMST